MFYSLEEKAKMDAVLLSFQSYVDAREDYDVLYSQKAGYLRVMVGESCDAIYFPITGFYDMVQMFVNDYLSEENPAGNYREQDYLHVRGKLSYRLDALGMYRQEAYGILEETFEACRIRRAQFRQNRLEMMQQLKALYHELKASLPDSES